MDPDAFIRRYYRALEAGERLPPFFAESPAPVKFGITEALHGFEAVASGLREQTRSTHDWDVTSHRLETGSRGDVGWFSDQVTMRWRQNGREKPIEWETRWSGTVVRTEDEWQFVRMHVSAAADDV